MAHGLSALIVLLMSLIVVAAVFLVCRALVLWYWKVDEIVDLLRSIDRRLATDARRPTPIELKASSSEVRRS